jgi:hypothetical protein
MELPHSAASIITPMMLLTLTSTSSLATHTSASNRFASFTNSAAGLACNPYLLEMRTCALCSIPDVIMN